MGSHGLFLEKRAVIINEQEEGSPEEEEEEEKEVNEKEDKSKHTLTHTYTYTPNVAIIWLVVHRYITSILNELI